MKLYTADAIKEQVHKLLCKDCEEPYVCPVCDYRELIDEILDAPTVEAETVKHGEWIPKITVLGTMIFRCSACQKFSDVHWAYCPQCGAKMDGERREDEQTL